jgi:hypothetical protein
LRAVGILLCSLSGLWTDTTRWDTITVGLHTKRRGTALIGRHPVDGHALNAVEQINQTWTYLAALSLLPRRATHVTAWPAAVEPRCEWLLDLRLTQR